MSDELRIFSFPPIARRDAQILILGSMPGKASLEADQYYAHPRNLFWPIMGALYGAGLDQPYKKRLQMVKDHKIALWESLQSCVRRSSLDSDILYEIPNAFAAFFAAHPCITHVFFNGAKAAQSFRRHVRDCPPALILTTLPSTSPAHASRNFQQKLEAWSVIKYPERLKG